MFIVRFQGGLGNQMFQYAFYKSLKYYYPQVDVLADITAYNKYVYHNGYELERVFGICVQKAQKRDVMKLSHYIPPWKYGDCIQRLLWKKILFRQNNVKKSEVTRLNGLYFDPTVYQFTMNDDEKYFDGYWTNEKYFNKVKATLIEDFSFKNIEGTKEKFLNDIGIYTAVSVHIRRGDYEKLSEFNIVKNNYYQLAVSYIKKRIKKPLFFVFSDDIAYVKRELSFLSPCIFVEENDGKNSYRDMYLMTQCQHNIITNSTFSFWGAYLNHNPDKIVIAPKRYMATQAQPLAVDSWTIINNK